MPADGKNPEQWWAADKFAVVVETASMNEAELGEYCGHKGLYLEQIAAWREACLQANADQEAQNQAQRKQSRHARQQFKKLERELRRKDKALAETTAPMVLEKSPGHLEGQRGRMITHFNRCQAVALIDEAVAAGARCRKACQVLGISVRTYQRGTQRSLSMKLSPQSMLLGLVRVTAVRVQPDVVRQAPVSRGARPAIRALRFRELINLPTMFNDHFSLAGVPLLRCGAGRRGDGLTTDEREELARLRRENRLLK